MKKNRLEYFKKNSVQFGFGFISMKSKNQIEQIQLRNKSNRTKKTEPKKPITSKKKPKKQYNFQFLI